MPLPAPARVVTGNALRSGRVVWLTADEQWSPDMRAASVFLDAAEAEAALACAQAQTRQVVGCYLAEVQPTSKGPEPVHFREAFRRDGPSLAARIPDRE